MPETQISYMKKPGHTQTGADAKIIQRVQEIALDAPDIREDKVNETLAEIAEGRFQVDSEAVAKKMLQDILASPKLPER